MASDRPILLVDDNPTILDAPRWVPEAAGYTDPGRLARPVKEFIR